MKIGIDCRMWNETGVGRYIRNLVSNLDRIDKKNEYVLFVKPSDRVRVKSLASNLRSSIIDTDIPWHSIREQTHFPKILNTQNLDLVHFPYFSIPIFYYKPFVVTVHDLIINKSSTGKASTLPYPAYFIKRLGYHAVLASAVYRASKIIVPSNAVRSDLLSAYRNLSTSKIEVTNEGGFESGRGTGKKKSQIKIEGKYLLRVGNFYPHKNVENLILAFKNFIYEDYDNHNVKLVLVGKEDYFSKRMVKLTSDLDIGTNIVFLSNVSDADLESLYHESTATIVPSLMEGFSLTAVEAMGAGSPVIASDIPVHREICGGAAIYCDPRDINDISQKINFAFSLVDDSRKELVDQGLAQSKKFSWKKMAERTLSVYQSAV